ncbi:hypothetical protein ACFFGR_14810 [Arthrobacter liuii]|uniref:Uncharacterized protein n=1 Tax=Arthrobacter liuii TaxID=1476996 RepID=A0ABQ2AYR4_9MICC|nr:hypothetical protein [Arthrobacter liuii]GGH99298.1 hypothetical protein GCM10007170_33810 [Arthrobacter liuii]
MDDPHRHDGGRPGRPRRAPGWDSPRVYRVLALVFTVTAGGALALVILDLFISRPIPGDLFVLTLNSLAAAVLWRRARAGARA